MDAIIDKLVEKTITINEVPLLQSNDGNSRHENSGVHNSRQM